MQQLEQVFISDIAVNADHFMLALSREQTYAAAGMDLSVVRLESVGCPSFLKVRELISRRDRYRQITVIDKPLGGLVEGNNFLLGHKTTFSSSSN